MKRIRLTRAQVQDSPSIIWDAFVRLLFETPTEELVDDQVTAQVAAYYNSEIRNGGHLQFFLNTQADDSFYDDFSYALETVGAKEHREILADSLKVWHSRPRKQNGAKDEHVALALRVEFEAMDARFHETAPSLEQWLERYFLDNQDLFIEVV